MGYMSAVEAIIFVSCILLFKRFEHLSLFHALYFGIITVTTTGYGDFHPTTDAGRVIASVLSFTGVGYTWLSLSVIVAVLIEGHAIRLWRENRMERQIARLKNHVVSAVSAAPE